jgi:hypothetical protein
VLCCANYACAAFSLNAPWSLPSKKNACQNNQNCCSLSSNLGRGFEKNTYAMNITTGVVL